MKNCEKNDVIFFVCHSILMCAEKILIFSARLRQGFCNALYQVDGSVVPFFPVFARGNSTRSDTNNEERTEEVHEQQK